MAQVKNWKDFQHYKDRSPPWLKLHRGLLDDYDYARLPLASKALAPLLWLLASESEDGVCIDTDYLAFRLRWSEADVIAGLNPLIDNGFLIPAINPLATCLQGACLETEGETEGEGEKDSASADSSLPPEDSKKKKSSPMKTITEWTAGLEGDAIPADDVIFEYSRKAGIPDDFLYLAWVEFETRSAESGKKQKDWRATFRNCVKSNWYRLWAIDREGGYFLTTEGKQAQRASA